MYTLKGIMNASMFVKFNVCISDNLSINDETCKLTDRLTDKQSEGMTDGQICSLRPRWPGIPDFHKARKVQSRALL